MSVKWSLYEYVDCLLQSLQSQLVNFFLSQDEEALQTGMPVYGTEGAKCTKSMVIRKPRVNERILQ